MSQGWSLLSSTIAFQAQVVFEDGAKFTSVWKWGGGKWLVFIPGETTSGAYAASKGFDNLTGITSGQGFWVESKADQQVTISGTLDYSPLIFTPGWDLVGLKSDQAISVTAMTSLNSDIVSMWVWENGNWLVAMPGETTMGAYAASKKFGELTTIYPLEGFWLNVK
jgi:hypothetical protein